MKANGRQMTTVEWGLLLTLSTVWGGSFFFYKILDGELPVLTIVLARVGIAALIMQCLALFDRDRIPLAALPWRQFAVMALLNNVLPFSLIVFAEKHIPSGLAAILNATTPIFTALAAHQFGDEKLTRATALGVTLGFGGVAMLMAPHMTSAGGNALAIAASLVAALLYAFAAIYGRRFRGLPPMTLATGQVTASTLILLPLTAWIDRPWQLPTLHLSTLGVLFGLALLCTVLAYNLYFRLLATSGATNLQLGTVLSPVSAVLLGNLFLAEHVNVMTLAGLLAIGSGLAVLDGRALKLLRRILSPRAAGEELR